MTLPITVRPRTRNLSAPFQAPIGTHTGCFAAARGSATRTTRGVRTATTTTLTIATTTSVPVHVVGRVRSKVLPETERFGVVLAGREALPAASRQVAFL